MTALTVSLNADIGEGFGPYDIGDDAALMAVLTDVNIACGFHGGDPSIMRARVRRATELGLGIGAHVSYPDLRGFGRRSIGATPEEVYADTVYQLGALAGFCAAAGASVGHVKPHGALYHDAGADAALAEAVATAVRDVDPRLAIFCPDGTALAERARADGLAVVAECFVDRTYTPAGGLTPRSQPNALVHDPAEAARRAVEMVREARTTASDGTLLAVRAETLCVHSDSPGAAAIVTAVRAALEGAGIRVASPAAHG